MSEDNESRLIDLLLAEGKISEQDVASLNPSPDPGGVAPAWGLRVEGLVRAGVLSREDAREALAKLRRKAMATEVLGPGAALAADASLSATMAGDTLGRYQILGVLGEGGMGRVYKAFDPQLKRTVALKVMRVGGEALRARFVAEAQSQARLAHANICPIYEVGEAGGVPFIAMQYIEGTTLQHLQGRLTVEEKALIVRKAAEAAHEAHRAGLIHRDIKPGNIIVERTGGGEWKPYVVDFGLARELAGPGVTEAGAVLGTPAYLSPEQAAGKALDRRSDVYSLGATLYAALAGQPPYEGSSLDVLGQLATRDPVPVHKRVEHLPRDLDTLVMKCLERDPARRYASAKALADDLGRFLDGEPIEARRSSLAYRAGKRLRKNRAATAMAGLALLVILGLAVWGLQTKVNASRRARLALVFGQEADRMEGLLHLARLQPLHDLNRERGEVRRELADLERRIRQAGAPGQEPGLYALGRVHMALGEDAEARRLLEAAWRGGYQTPEVAFALGQSLGELFSQAAEQARRMSGPSLPAAQRAELRRDLQEPALAYLRASSGVQGASPAYVRALMATYDLRYEEALRNTEEAIKEAPWDFDILALKGDIQRKVASAKKQAGDYAAARRAYEEAGMTYARVLDAIRSDPVRYQSESLRCIELAEVIRHTGGSPEEALSRAIAVAKEALEADPSSDQACSWMSDACWHLASWLQDQGKDPASYVTQGVEAALRAVQLDPRNAAAYHNLGTIYWSQADLLSERGQSSDEALKDAKEAFEKAVALSPGQFISWMHLSYIQNLLASREEDRGRDPRPLLSLAEECSHRAMTLEPREAAVRNNLGVTLFTRGEYEIEHGFDPRASLEKTRDAFQAALALNPRDVYAFNNLGETFGLLARWTDSTGGDPRPFLDKGSEQFIRAAAINPRFQYAVCNAGQARAARAAYEQGQGRDPEPDLREALAQFEAAIALKPTYGTALAEEARARLQLASCFLARQADPHAEIAAARDLLARLERVNPKDARIAAERGAADITEARRLGRSGATLFGRGEGLLLDAAKQSQDDGVLLLRIARWARDAAAARKAFGIDGTPAADCGLQACERLLVINPSCAEAKALKASFLLAKAPAGGAPEAKALLEEALKANPNLAHAYGPLLK